VHEQGHACGLDPGGECFEKTWWLAGRFVEALLKRAGPVAGLFARSGHDALGCWQRSNIILGAGISPDKDVDG
jgi:hypothetical protein